MEAFLVGKPILSVLIYAVIELICMGIFYHALQKYNNVISLIVYCVIKIIINQFYRTLTKSILLDLLLNFIIGTMIIIAYRKIIKMEDIKWFVIIGMMINTILTFFIVQVWRITGATFVISMLVLGTLYLPYIIGVILSVIVICLIRKKLVEKEKRLKILIYAIICIFCILVSTKLGYTGMLYASAKPDKIYVEMNKINDNQSLIGLSKEQVIELLGEPYHKEKDVYYYDAGKITNYLFFGGRDFYSFRVIFDENEIVKATSIKMIP